MGNGKSILTVLATWIPENRNYMVSRPIVNTKIRVSDLINQTNKTWQRDIICSTFNNADADSILQFPLARARHEDLLVWRDKATRDFSVQSGYKILLESEIETYENNLQHMAKLFYKKLYNIDINPK